MGTRLESQTQSGIQNKGASDPIDPQRFLFVRAHHMHTQRCGANKNIVFLTPALSFSPLQTHYLYVQQTISHHLQKARSPRRNITPAAAANTEQAFSFYLKNCLYFSIIIFVRGESYYRSLSKSRARANSFFFLSSLQRPSLKTRRADTTVAHSKMCIIIK